MHFTGFIRLYRFSLTVTQNSFRNNNTVDAKLIIYKINRISLAGQLLNPGPTQKTITNLSGLVIEEI